MLIVHAPGSGGVTGFLVSDGATGVGVGTVNIINMSAVQNAYCGQYGQISNQLGAPVIQPNGRAGFLRCNDTSPAACSAPVAIPVAP